MEYLGVETRHSFKSEDGKLSVALVQQAEDGPYFLEIRIGEERISVSLLELFHKAGFGLIRPDTEGQELVEIFAGVLDNRVEDDRLWDLTLKLTRESVDGLARRVEAARERRKNATKR